MLIMESSRVRENVISCNEKVGFSATSSFKQPRLFRSRDFRFFILRRVIVGALICRSVVSFPTCLSSVGSHALFSWTVAASVSLIHLLFPHSSLFSSVQATAVETMLYQNNDIPVVHVSKSDGKFQDIKENKNETFHESEQRYLFQMTLNPRKYLAMTPTNPLTSSLPFLSVAKNRHTSKKCHALVLSGGGNKGSYQAGVIKGLSEKFNSEGKELRWDVVAGVSVGALNAFTSLYHSPGNEAAWANELVKMWIEKIDQSSLTDCKGPFKNNIPRLISRWFKSFFRKGKDNSELLSFCTNKFENFIKDYYADRNPNFLRHVVVSATRLNDGSYVSFTEKSDWTTLLKGVRASSAVPLIFPPVEIPAGSKLFHYDGGLLYNANIAEAVERCMKEKNVATEDVVVDFISCVPAKSKYFSMSNSSTGEGQKLFKLLTRTLGIMRSRVSGRRCLEEAKTRYPGFQLRYYVKPNKKVYELLQRLSLTEVADRKWLRRMVEEGIKDGKQALPGQPLPKQLPPHLEVMDEDSDEIIYV